MKEQEQKMKLPKLDDLFTSQEQRDYEKAEKVEEIDISKISNFPNHPFKVVNDDKMDDMVKSVKEYGVILPVIIRPKDNGTYEMISGHRRKFASQLALKETMPCIVRELSDDEAIIIMVDSNMQREEILPSEKAFAYKMKLDAMKHQGVSFGQVVRKWESTDDIGKDNEDSGRQVRRYIRLTKLIPELLDKVDTKEIAFNPAVELSYLTEEEQYALLDCIEYNDATPSHAQAIIMKKLSQEGSLNEEKIDDILSQEKPNQIPKMKFSEERIRSVLPKNVENDKIEDFVVKAIEYYSKHLRQKDMGAR